MLGNCVEFLQLAQNSVYFGSIYYVKSTDLSILSLSGITFPGICMLFIEVDCAILFYLSIVLSTWEIKTFGFISQVEAYFVAMCSIQKSVHLDCLEFLYTGFFVYISDYICL